METMKQSQREGTGWCPMAVFVAVVMSAGIATIHEGRLLVVQALLPTWHQAFGDELFMLLAGVALFMRGRRRLAGSALVLTAIWMVPLFWWVVAGVDLDTVVAVASEGQVVAALMIATAAGLIVEEMARRRHLRLSPPSSATATLRPVSTHDGANHG